MGGLRGRWLLNGILLVVILVFVAVAACALSLSNYYYAGIQTGLESKAKTASDVFTTYVSKNYAEYQQMAHSYAEGFEEKDKIELQFVSTRGKVETSSYYIASGSNPGTPDIAAALETKEISSWSGRSSETGERILAVSSPLLTSDGQAIGVMRYVTSLSLVDRQVFRTTAIVGAVGLLVVVIVLLSNVYFIRSITEPIRELTVMARRIAEGSYGIQVEKKYDDEIGDLTDTINEMSLKIGQSEKVQTEFISSVSHELRTPLTAITGWSETLMYDDEIKGDSLRGINIIAKEAGRLTKMVEELLEFTRIQDGRFNVNISEIDIAAELEDSIFTFGELLRQDNIELQYTPCEQDIPHITGDASRLKQVFLNIIDNAAKYGREGGRVAVTMGLEEGFVTISIRDFGPGIPESELPYVTKKFYKGSSKERGSGIGLAVCEEIIARHKGTLTIKNAEDGGALVIIRLPIQVAK